MSERPPDLHRRRTLLKSLAVAAALPWTGQGAAQRAARPLPALVTGVLLPARSAVPELAQRYLSGLQLGLGPAAAQVAGSRPTELLIRFAGSRPAEWEAAARDLLSAGAQVLVALGDGLQARLGPLAEQHHTPLIVSELGSLMPRGERHSPFVFGHSLQLWQAEWALGVWSAQRRERVQVLTSLLESGYDLPYAYASGVASAGGSLIETSVADDFSGAHDFPAALARIRQLQPDHLHIVASQSGFLELVRAARRELGGPAALSTAGLALTAGAGVTGSRSALSWTAELDSPLNRQFVAAYQRRTHQSADALAVLGYEAATWLLQALNTVGTSPSEQLQPWLSALAQARFQSPRGEVWADQDRSLQAPIYLRQSLPGGARVLGVLPAPPRRHPALQALLEHPRSGWSQVYLHA